MYTSHMDTGTKKDMKIEGDYSPLDAVTPQLETQSTIPPSLLKWTAVLLEDSYSI